MNFKTFMFALTAGLASITVAACSTSEQGASSPVVDPSPAVAAEKSSPVAAAIAKDPETTITLGDITNNPVKKIRRYKPFADHLASQLKATGITDSEVKVAPDLETMASMIASGEIDLYFDSPFPAMVVSDLSGAKPILRRWKKGVGSYHTIIFTRADSDVKTLEDLKGKVVAFDDRVSTSGYMLPLAHLKEKGFSLSEKASAQSSVEDETVGYVFSKDDDSSIEWVLNKRVGAAAIGSSDFLDIPPKTRDQLRILAKTESVPRQLVMVSPAVPPEQIEAIRKLLLTLDKSEKGKQLLQGFEKTAKFDALPKASDQSFARMRELYELVKEQ
ncbi:MAG: phosphate/phosphite/phosphonate ABC transporter substrate-binding protein [Cyanobacteria bacterium P01_C01_bin.89]